MAKKLLSVAKSWSGTPPQFDTYIPSLADAANIEDAFKLFMYGTSDNGGESTVIPTSLYSNLLSIKNTADQADDLAISHSSASTNVHGLSASASVVGTNTTQILSNKTLDNPIIPSVNGDMSVSGSVSVSSNLLSSGSVFVSGNVVGHIDILDRTSNYTLSLSDDGKLIQMNVSSANSVTIPLNSSAAFPVGTQITVVQAGTGQTTIVAADPGVTINVTPGLKLRARWSAASLIKLGTNSWLVTGDLTS